uniref:Uncharacterized protein n=1 Tax=Pristionchus pacificus TaxID=54126 RepID=A0A2A6BD47_PRIPA|eukprot:PDM63813.1 hypothetical protein PRIPAC_49786 [Pristionchus pacificus]
MTTDLHPKPNEDQRVDIADVLAIHFALLKSMYFYQGHVFDARRDVGRDHAQALDEVHDHTVSPAHATEGELNTAILQLRFTEAKSGDDAR